jgi:hypothetical protein
VRIELTLKRNIASLSGFYSVKNIIFVQNSSFQVNGRSTVSLVREQLMLQARGSGTLFNIVN